MSKEEDFIPVLLFPRHLTPTASHLPLLTSLQHVINEAYFGTCAAHPDIFGRFTRLPDPSKFGDEIGEHGFTIALVRPSVDGSHDVVATGSVKSFGKGLPVEPFKTWFAAHRKHGLGREEVVRQTITDSVAEEVRAGRADGEEERMVYEVNLFATSRDVQAKGLGGRVLEDIDWVVRNLSRMETGGLLVKESDGYDLRQLRRGLNEMGSEIGRTEKSPKPVLVLIAIKEAGLEGYYNRKGYRSVWSGLMPVTQYGWKKECTMIYMEKDPN